jgi:hypothetical protein
MTRLTPLAFTLCAAISSAALATDCASQSENLLAGANCSFDRDLTGWQAAPGDEAPAHEAKEGQPRAGALRAAGGSNGSITVLGPCLPALPGIYEIGGSFRSAAGTPYYCAVDALQYADATCTLDEKPLVAAGQPPAEGWKSATSSAVTDGDTGSVRVRLGCSGKPDFEVLFDEVSLYRR